MAKYILDHLDDNTFRSCVDELDDAMRNACKGIFDSWVEKGYIADAERDKLMSEYEFCGGEMFASLG